MLDALKSFVSHAHVSQISDYCQLLQWMNTLQWGRDIVEISHVTYRKLDELKCSDATCQNSTIRLDPFETQIERSE